MLSPESFLALFLHLGRQLAPLLPPAPPSVRVRRGDAATVTASAKLLHCGLLQRARSRAKNQTARRRLQAGGELSAAGLPHLLRVCRERSEANDPPALGRSLTEATTPGDRWGFDRGGNDRARLLSLHQRDSDGRTPHCRQGLRGQERLWECPDPPATPEEARAELAATARAHPKTPAPGQLLWGEQAGFENAEDARHPSWPAKWAEMPLQGFHGARSPRRSGVTAKGRRPMRGLCYCRCAVRDGKSAPFPLLLPITPRRSQAWEPLVRLPHGPLAADRQRMGPFALAEVPEV